MSNNQTSYLFKVIRADNADFWNDFAGSLIWPENGEYRKELRKGVARKGFSYRIYDSKFQVIPTDKKDPSRKSVWSQYLDIKDDYGKLEIFINGRNKLGSLPKKTWSVLKEKGQSDQEFEKAKQEKIEEAINFLKYKFTKNQSTSLCVTDNDSGEFSFRSQPFGHNKSRSELLVGVMLKADLCHIQRVIKYDAGTVYRSYDQRSKHEVEKFLNNKKNIHFPSMEKMVDNFNGQVKTSNHTEIMAALGLSFNLNGFAITVFSDNLESRLLAQLRQISFLKLAKQKHQDLNNSLVPIIIYGEDKLINYDFEKQEQDRELKGEDVKYQHYVDAINYILGNAQKLSDNYLTDDFIRLVAQVDRGMLSHLLTTNLDKTCNAITCADTFFMVYKNLNSDQQQQLLEQTKSRLLDLEPSSENNSILHMASRNGHKDVVKVLIKNGARVNASNQNRVTALMYAAQNGHKDVVEALLIGKGADVNATDSYNRTALMIAAKYGHKDVVEALIGRGAKVNATDSYDHTALMIAAKYGHKDVVEVLIKNGSRVNASNQNRVTALMYAAQYGHKDVVKALIGKSAKVNAKASNGGTALMMAAKYGHKDVVEALLEKSSVEQLLSIYLNPKESGLCGPVVLNKLNEFDANEIITILIKDKVPCRSNTIDLFQLCLNQCLDTKNTPNEECITKLIKYGIDSPDFMRYCNGYRGNHNFTDPKLAAFFDYAKTKYFGIFCSGKSGLKRFAKILWPSDSDDKAKSTIDAIEDYIESRSGGCVAFLRSHNRSSAALDAAQQAQAMNLAEDEACPSQEGEVPWYLS